MISQISGALEMNVITEKESLEVTIWHYTHKYPHYGHNLILPNPRVPPVHKNRHKGQIRTVIYDPEGSTWTNQRMHNAWAPRLHSVRTPKCINPGSTNSSQERSIHLESTWLKQRILESLFETASQLHPGRNKFHT